MIKKNEFINPNPVGWFAIALSKDIKPGIAIQGILCNKPYRLERCKNGELIAEGSVYALVEQNGFILAWHHPHNIAPNWVVPHLDEEGWQSMRFHTFSARTHPQEIYENSIDMTHFPIVHGFTDMDVLHAPQFEENVMRVRYALSRDNPLPFVNKKISPNFEVFLYGLGCAHNYAELSDLGLEIRMLVLSTPTKKGWVDIRIGVSIGKNIKLPLKRFLLPFIHRGIMKNNIKDFCQDVAIWENKRYLPIPVLARGDGPIVRFRQWCKKYYISDIGCDGSMNGHIS